MYVVQLQELEQNWAEPLHEYSQFAAIIKKLLGYRHQKHVQFEMTQDGLDNKREQLEELERSEKEAQRLEEALGRGKAVTGLSPSPPTVAGVGAGEVERTTSLGDEETEPGLIVTSANESDTGEGTEPQTAQQEAFVESPSPPSESYLPPHPGPNPVKRRTRAPGMGFLNALSYTLHGMMDVDPETARRNTITKTRETISQLEEGLHLSAQDLKYSSTAIQADLDRFQRQKVADLREMCIGMAKSHRDWCKKVFFSHLEESFIDQTHFHPFRIWKHGKRQSRKLKRYPIIPTNFLRTERVRVVLVMDRCCVETLLQRLTDGEYWTYYFFGCYGSAMPL